MEKETNNKLSKWLEILQQESWQLELIISGFAIFLILGIYEPLQELRFNINLLSASDSTYALLRIPHTFLQWVWYALIINLTTHVLFRGLWISTIGLRYVSGDVDFDHLQLKEPFNDFLRKRIKSFDHYIERLERICSVIFAFTFLIIFMIISLGMFFFFFIGFNYLLTLFPESLFFIANMLRIILTLLLLLSGFIYFIDFLTLGWLKRSKWFAPIYYPFYRIMSWVTGASLYRPMYYNLIDNKFGRWLGYFLVPYTIIIIMFISLKIETHTYIPKQSSEYKFSHAQYDDQRKPKTSSSSASIQSKYINNGFVELFMPYNPRTDDKAIGQLCPDLKPAKKTGFIFTGSIRTSFSKEPDLSTPDSAMTCMSQLHQIYVNDSLYQDVKFKFYDHPERKRPGLLTILNVDHLGRGEHQIKTMTYFHEEIGKGDTILLKESATIPFWKE